MRIGLMVLSIGNFGNKGYYNLQEVGLAKALASRVAEVLIYRLIDKNKEEIVENIAGYRNVKMYLLPSRRVGSNGIPDFKKIDSNIDVLVCFSDTNIFFPIVNDWCEKNSIKLIPYIGVSKSHSNNLIKQKLINLLFFRNLKIYKKTTCLAKTPKVAEELREQGVMDVKVAPVGLDLELLNLDYGAASVGELKKKYGFLKSDRVVLFIGRMTAEKQPERMIKIFKRVWEENQSFKLLMVGRGELSEKVLACIRENDLENVVKIVERIPNKDIWELYRLSESFVNLNQHEIYGMVLLEAMFYGCKVIAWRAPGPEYIIDNGKDGFLVSNEEQVIERILKGENVRKEAHEKIASNFTWNYTAREIVKIIKASNMRK